MEEFEPRNTAPESGCNQIRIQGLEEVTEMSEESDVTSQLSLHEKEDLNRSHSSIDSESETNERIQMSEKVLEIESLSRMLFSEPPIQFRFDFEDYNNCKLNCKLKKLIT